MNEFWSLTLGTHGLGALELLRLFSHFLLLSLLAVGGAITTAPEMQRFLVDQNGWMTAEQFSASVGLAQAAPGPNVLFIAVLGWNTAGPLGMLATMIGIMIPSCTLTWMVARWLAAHREARGVTVFTAGLAPLTIGLLGSTGWVLSAPVRDRPLAWVLVAVTVWVMMRTRWSPMWLIALGAVVGAAGGV